MEAFAVWALKVGVFDQGYNRVGITVDVIALDRDGPDVFSLLVRLLLLPLPGFGLCLLLLQDELAYPFLYRLLEDAAVAHFLDDFLDDFLLELLAIGTCLVSALRMQRHARHEHENEPKNRCKPARSGGHN